ncbi:unnamed protein product, partial [Ceratitis capitata]
DGIAERMDLVVNRAPVIKHAVVDFGLDRLIVVVVYLLINSSKKTLLSIDRTLD